MSRGMPSLRDLVRQAWESHSILYGVSSLGFRKATKQARAKKIGERLSRKDPDHSEVLQ